MELLEFRNNLSRKWQRKIYQSCWVSFCIILSVELVVFVSYLWLGAIKPEGVMKYLLIRVVFPSGVNFITLLVTRWFIHSLKIPVETKNYAVCINILIICSVTAAVHNYYFIIWMAPSVALFYSTLFHNNRILTVVYIGTIVSAFISMGINILEGQFDEMVSVNYCVFVIGLFTCGYYISRIIIKHHNMQLTYIYQELEKKQILIHRLDIEPMTRLYNRKAFERNLKEIQKNDGNLGGDNPQKVWLVILDLDYFKSINDTYGHLNGDTVLLTVASVLQDVVGKEGRVYRYGGEEFAVLTHACIEKEIYEMAEKIRIKVELLRFEFDVNRQVTISAGISAYHKNVTLKKWIETADDALYYAKRNGRNRFEIKR